MIEYFFEEVSYFCVTSSQLKRNGLAELKATISSNRNLGWPPQRKRKS